MAQPPLTRADRHERAPSGSRLRRWALLAALAPLAVVGMVAFFESQGTPAPSPSARGTASSSTPPATATTTTRPPTSSAPTRTQPAVPTGLVGQDVHAATDLLKGLGYRVEKVDVDSRLPKDTVVATVPAQGRPLSAGQTVLLIVSKGDVERRGNSFVVPPGLVGQQSRSIERLLRGVARVNTVGLPSTQDPGTVIATWPTSGQTATTARLLLVVATAPDHED